MISNLRQVLTVLNPPEDTEDQKRFTTLKPITLVPVLEPSETTYTNLINATLVDLAKQFKTIQYDSSSMIMSCGDQMLLICVMEDYMLYRRSQAFYEFFSYITVVIKPVDNMYEGYTTIDHFMEMVFAWIKKVLRVK